MASVSLRSMTKTYGDNTVVDTMDLDIEDGEFFTLLGPSGCGKTTTLRCVAGLERPDGGDVRIGGDTVFDASAGLDLQPDKRGAGMVFQTYALWPHMSVLSNVAYPLRRRGVNRSESKDKAEQALAQVSLTGLGDRSVAALSGGQQQRVALARALVAEPRLILFDEPLSNLDAKLRGEMRDQIGILQKRLGTTAIYVTHDQTEALTLSDRIAVMDKGRIQQLGTPHEIYSSPKNAFVADFVGFENMLRGRIRSRTDSGSGIVDIDGVGAIEVDDIAASSRTSDVLVAFRSTDTVISDHELGRANVVAATVTKAVYLGEQIEITFAVAGHTVKLRTNSAASGISAYPEGATVSLRIPRNAQVLEDTNVQANVA